ncbi:MAG TPA: TIGR02757 family protein [bacterium]|nr:TIGR02757 family protein [bacterium]
MPAARLKVVHEPASREILKGKLDAVAEKYGRAYLGTDPLKFVHRYSDPLDQEVVALVAAAFAYGNVKVIFRAVERLLDLMGESPRAYLEEFDAVRERARLRGFRHRFHSGRDAALFFSLVAQAIRRHGSLGELFARGFSPRDEHVGPALSRFVEEILSGDPRPFYPSGKIPQPHGVRFLLSSPDDGSACKRMLLFLRWMIRPADGVDVGCWSRLVPASKLLIPLDTHTFRICRFLGFTARNAGDFRAAEECTAVLRTLDAADPVKYDFSLCRLGILDLCPSRRDEKKCVPCDLYEVCRL